MTVQGRSDSGLSPEYFDFHDEGGVVENGSCQQAGRNSGDRYRKDMRFAHLDDSGLPKPLAVVGRLGCMVDMKLEVEERYGLDFVRMPANLCPD